MSNITNFKKLSITRAQLSSTSLLSEKRNILKDYIQNSDSEFNNRIFNLINNNHIKFHITSNRVRSTYTIENTEDRELFSMKDLPITDEDILVLYDKLLNGELRGKVALSTCVSMYSTLLSIDIDVAQLFLDIIDKNLKCGVSSSIMESIPHNEDSVSTKRKFGVSLANKYFDQEKRVDFETQSWFASRKCDGLRCICIKENGVVRFFSRQEREFTTLDVLRNLIERCPEDNFVLDGELCVVDSNGDENFQDIIKLARRKDYTIPNPFYQLFDMLTIDEFFGYTMSPDFHVRIMRMEDFFKHSRSLLESNVKILQQTLVRSIKHFEELLEEARSKDWEGLMLRRDISYEGRRTNNLLKVKDFLDDEFCVIDYEVGPMRMIENGQQVERNVLTNVIVEYKGNRVSVGSGFSKEERIHYAEHPEDIIGHQITVKYFEETISQSGLSSIRFPVVKHVYDKEGRLV